MCRWFKFGRRWSASLIAVAILGGACSDSESAEPVPTLDTTSTTGTTGATTPTTTEPAAEPQSDLDDLADLWQALWTASGLVPDERGPAIAELGDAVDPEVAAGVPTMVLADTLREVSTFPVFERQLDGTVEIRDCIIYEPEIWESVTHVHSGTAEPDGNGGWIINSVLRESRGCVPATLADQILSDYAEYLAAVERLLEPTGSPSSPLHRCRR